MKKHYRLVLQGAGQAIVINGIATCHAAAEAAARKFAGVGADAPRPSASCEGPIDVDISTPGATGKRIHHYGFNNYCNIRMLADADTANDVMDKAAAAYARQFGAAEGIEHSSYSPHSGVVSFEA